MKDGLKSAPRQSPGLLTVIPTLALAVTITTKPALYKIATKIKFVTEFWFIMKEMNGIFQTRTL